MYYPESATIASENTHLAEAIQKVDKFLFERQGKPFYAGTAADVLQLKLANVQGILNLYKDKNALSERKVWLCPKDREEIAFVSDDALHCPTCGQNYQEDECEASALYSAVKIEITKEAEQASAPAPNMPTPLNPLPNEPLLLNDSGSKREQSNTNKKKWNTAIVGTILAGVFVILAAIIQGTFGLWQGVFADQNPTVIEEASAQPSQIVDEILETAELTESVQSSQTPDETVEIGESTEAGSITNCFVRIGANESLAIYNAPNVEAQLIAQFTEGQTEVYYSSQDMLWLQINYDTGSYGGLAWIQVQPEIEFLGDCENIPVFDS